MYTTRRLSPKRRAADVARRAYARAVAKLKSATPKYGEALDVRAVALRVSNLFASYWSSIAHTGERPHVEADHPHLFVAASSFF